MTANHQGALFVAQWTLSITDYKTLLPYIVSTNNMDSISVNDSSMALSCHQ